MKNTQQNPAGHTAEQSAGKLYSVILPQSSDSGRAPAAAGETPQPRAAQKPKRKTAPKKDNPSVDAPAEKAGKLSAEAPAGRKTKPAAGAPAEKTAVRAASKKKPTAAEKPASKPPLISYARNRSEKSEAAHASKPRQSRQNGKSRASTLRIIPLGGIEEVGKNITAYEYKQDIIIVDCGLEFPDDELFGVDIVIPDFSYLISNRSRVRGIFITHGHEDHIGGLPYLLRELEVPIYGTKLTLGLIKAKLKESAIVNPDMVVIEPGQTISLGDFTVEPIHVNHSIPDAVGYAISCPVGTVVYTGDFKIDYTPITDKIIDLNRFAALGREGVLALLVDSTNAERPGYTPTERRVSLAINNLIHGAGKRRIIIASFASNIQRIQQIIDLASSVGRKVALSGRSMINYTEIAAELGYLKFDKDLLVDISEIPRYRDDELLIITTGSQGEPLSALSRMAAGSHRQVTVSDNDLIIISANPIPGNEKSVGKIVNALLKKGSEVIYESMYDVHVSGHACQEEIKTIIDLVKPQYYIPVHGEYKHLYKNAGLARLMGLDDKHIIIPEIGRVLEFSADGKLLTEETVPAGRVLVDGIGVGDVGNVVLRDRKQLSEDGMIVAVLSVDSNTGEIISGPDIISRGFVYVKESERLIEDAKDLIVRCAAQSWKSSRGDLSVMKTKVREALNEYMYGKTKRSPMVLPVIIGI